MLSAPAMTRRPDGSREATYSPAGFFAAPGWGEIPLGGPRPPRPPGVLGVSLSATVASDPPALVVEPSNSLPRGYLLLLVKMHFLTTYFSSFFGADQGAPQGSPDDNPSHFRPNAARSGLWLNFIKACRVSYAWRGARRLWDGGRPHRLHSAPLLHRERPRQTPTVCASIPSFGRFSKESATRSGRKAKEGKTA